MTVPRMFGTEAARLFAGNCMRASASLEPDSSAYPGMMLGGVA
jgi:hypothetical protein